MSAAQLLRRLVLPPASAVDLGCGAGAWLLRLAADTPGVRLVGVDTSAPDLAQARSAADRAGCGDRVELLEGDAGALDAGRHAAVLCVGASHVFGGLDGTLRAVRDRLGPGGTAVLGDTVWEQAPSPAAQEALEAGPDDRLHGFEVVDGHGSTLEEWDDEWAWTGALVRWAVQQPAGSADRAEARRVAQDHSHAWLHGYRRSLGFATLVLADVSGDGS